MGDVLRVGDSFLIVSQLATGDEASPKLVGHSADVAELRARPHAGYLRRLSRSYCWEKVEPAKRWRREKFIV